jgi:hypothetical protein
MHFMKECAILTQKYLKEVEGQEITIDEILERPHHKQVWYWWLAKEHYYDFVIPMSKEECKLIYGK